MLKRQLDIQYFAPTASRSIEGQIDAIKSAAAEQQALEERQKQQVVDQAARDKKEADDRKGEETKRAEEARIAERTAKEKQEALGNNIDAIIAGKRAAVASLGIPDNELDAHLVLAQPFQMMLKSAVPREMTLSGAIALIMNSSNPPIHLEKFEGRDETGATIYGISVKVPEQRSFGFGFSLDGGEVFTTYFGFGNELQRLSESDRVKADGLLFNLLGKGIGD